MKKLSFSKLEKRQKEDWKKWANYWRLLTECARPSRNDIQIIGHIINKKIKTCKSPVIVILGSTPEFRDLCVSYAIEYKAKVVCVELVEDMYRAMTDLTLLKNKKEDVVFENWLSMSLPNEFANIVIGDLTEGNIEEKFKTKYLSEINRILKKNGKYIVRQTAYISKERAKPVITLKQIEQKLEIYKQKVLEGRITMHQAGNYLGAELAWDSWYKTSGKKISLSVYDAELEKIRRKIKEDNLKREILEILYKVWGPIKDKYWEYYSLDQTVNHFKKFFKDIKYHYSTDYPVAKYTPIFEMVKK